MSIEDLVELLHSVDHERVVTNDVISDSALEALLDRTLRKDKVGVDRAGFEEREREEDSLKAAAVSSAAAAAAAEHVGLFKVIAERDSRGNLIAADGQDKPKRDDSLTDDSPDGLVSVDKDKGDSPAEDSRDDPSSVDKENRPSKENEGHCDSVSRSEQTSAPGSGGAADEENQADRRSSSSPGPAPSSFSDQFRSSSVSSSATTTSSGSGSENADTADLSTGPGNVVITESVVGVATGGHGLEGEEEGVSRGSVSISAGSVETS